MILKFHIYQSLYGLWHLQNNKRVYEGKKEGWVEVSAQKAQDYANKGAPAIASFKRSGSGHGHIAMVRPDSSPYDKDKGPLITQAGWKNFNSEHARQAFGGYTQDGKPQRASLRRIGQYRYFVNTKSIN